jgi:acyl-CoA synthetase (AMP-forming)/AMP-acid ligase II
MDAAVRGEMTEPSFNTSGIPMIDTTDKSLWELIEERAALTPDKRMAIDEQGRTLTYGEYKAWAERVAAGLAATGVAEGTNVSWVLPSRMESIVLAAALARLGAVQNPILPIYRHREVGFIVRQTGCKVLIVPGVFRGFDYSKMAEELTADLDTDVLVADPDLPEGDPSTLGAPAPGMAADGTWPLRWIFYSSGTTADPKGAKHTDRTLSAANDGMQWSMEVTGADRAAVVFPITHVGGLVWLFNAMETGVELLMVEIFNPETTPKFLAEHGVTCAGAGTAFWLVYLAAQRKQPDVPLFPEVRIFNGGGAPKPVTLHREMLAEMGAPLIGGWGLTESPINTMVHVDDPDVKKAETDGRACPDVRIRVVSSEGEELGRNEEGELRVAGPQVCLGYVDSALDAEGFDADGWFRTGDLGTIDDDGFVRITGRLKDIIIRKGENISAKEIEDLLYAHPAIADAAVVGLPDPASGERAAAIVVLKPGATLGFQEMVAFLRDHQLSNHKLPEQLEVVEALPRNPSGKVLKRDLRQQYGS